MKRVYLNAVGLNNAIGNSVSEVAERLFAPSLQTGLEPYEQLFSGRETFVGRVKGNLTEIPPDRLPELRHFASRNTQLCLSAFAQIEEVSRYFIGKYGADRVGVVLGTSTSGIAEGEQAYKDVYPDLEKFDFDYRRQEITNLSLFLADYLNLTGVRFTVSTACSSSGRAVASGQRLIQSGLCDAVIVGGSDSLCELTLNGFDSLESVSQKICNPFSKNRNGINIGEGAALFVLSNEPAEVELLGIGESSDGYHISAPHPEGLGAELALRQALEEAKLQPEDIGYINLHGTATPKNDEAEGAAVHRIFSDQVAASSTKPLIGHTLGGAGAQELAFSYMTVSSEINPDGRIPVHHWDREQDPDIAAVKLAMAGDHLDKRISMSNNFAFGGNNISLIIGSTHHG